MRLLVLGGTGWLGGTVARLAAEQQHEVVALARGGRPAPPGVTLIAADRRDPDALDGVRSSRWDAIVDVATQPGAVRAAASVLEPVAARYLYVSSRSVYADQSAADQDESAAVVPPLEADELREMSDYGAAKVACEQAVLAAFGPDRALVARSGLIGGPGDETGRSTYWPWRFARPADPDGAVLAPDATNRVELVDVRDLAAWLLGCAEAGVAGTINTAGESLPFAEHLAVARSVAGHRGELVLAPEAELLRQGVDQWMGPRSFPLWLADPAFAGLGSCDTRRAVAAGLRTRPLAETLADALADELASGGPNPHGAGLTDEEERTLLAALRASR